ncbi:hypothetical protein K431DRAFT_149920 [Polychaeton citri CBS 116435]|uniref:Uncharacterized protein n=1 Tax=Polychaeton citri CBS 116435 TaxID=1314669 RepID=A0A9P4Q3B6_9PEZI|nr:hypothetical protein K431DRAFT_149920 [Polychaeton citri CBS 116435]
MPSWEEGWDRVWRQSESTVSSGDQCQWADDGRSCLRSCVGLVYRTSSHLRPSLSFPVHINQRTNPVSRLVCALLSTTITTAFHHCRLDRSHRAHFETQQRTVHCATTTATATVPLFTCLLAILLIQSWTTTPNQTLLRRRDNSGTWYRPNPSNKTLLIVSPRDTLVSFSLSRHWPKRLTLPCRTIRQGTQRERATPSITRVLRVCLAREQ